MADVDANVKCQLSKLEVKRGRLEIALSPGLHVICGTRSLDVSEILLEKVLSILRINLIGPWLSTRIYLGVVGLAIPMVTHTVYIIPLVNRTHCAITTEYVKSESL